MGVKVLTEKAGALQGVDIDSVVRQVYGKNSRYVPNDPGVDHLGDIVGEDNTLIDLVIDIHDV